MATCSKIVPIGEIKTVLELALDIVEDRRALLSLTTDFEGHQLDVSDLLDGRLVKGAYFLSRHDHGKVVNTVYIENTHYSSDGPNTICLSFLQGLVIIFGGNLRGLLTDLKGLDSTPNKVFRPDLQTGVSLPLVSVYLQRSYPCRGIKS